jgi:hypothetical protein
MLAALAAVTPPAPLWAASAGGADVVATYRVGNAYDEIDEASADGWLRIDYRFDNGEYFPSYVVGTPDQRFFRVFKRDGRWFAADVRDYGAWMRRQIGAEIIHAKPTLELFEKAGEEKVGAWTGTAYTIAHGCGRWRHLVVMHGNGGEVLGRALRASFWSAIKQKQHPNPCELQALDLIASGTLLRLEEQVLSKLETRRLDRARFRLPGPVLTREQLFALR